MTSPADRSYIKDHDWVQVGADGMATFGITEYAQDSLGDVVFVELPEAGRGGIPSPSPSGRSSRSRPCPT